MSFAFSPPPLPSLFAFSLPVVYLPGSLSLSGPNLASWMQLPITSIMVGATPNCGYSPTARSDY